LVSIVSTLEEALLSKESKKVLLVLAILSCYTVEIKGFGTKAAKTVEAAVKAV